MTQIQIRRGSAAAWTAANPILAQGELGFELDTNKVKVGNGSSAWNSLGYFPVSWNSLTDKPTYVAAGASAADARAAISAASLSGGKVPSSELAITVADIAASTTTALGVGSIELGHASDTTLSRSAAGTLAVEGVTVPTVSSTSTLTNKRITPRIGSTASSATPSIDSDSFDQYNITALAAAITSVTVTGTPTDGQKLIVRIKDNGTARAITWGSSFVSSGVAALPTTTVASKTHFIGFIYDSASTKWVCLAVDGTGY